MKIIFNARQVRNSDSQVFIFVKYRCYFYFFYLSVSMLSSLLDEWCFGTFQLYNHMSR